MKSMLRPLRSYAYVQLDAVNLPVAAGLATGPQRGFHLSFPFGEFLFQPLDDLWMGGSEISLFANIFRQIEQPVMIAAFE